MMINVHLCCVILTIAINCDDMLASGAARIVCSGLADSNEATGRYKITISVRCI